MNVCVYKPPKPKKERERQKKEEAERKAREEGVLSFQWNFKLPRCRAYWAIVHLFLKECKVFIHQLLLGGIEWQGFSHSLSLQRSGSG